MSDFSRFLPLSQRQRASEGEVSSDRRAALADVVAQAAGLLRTADAEHSPAADAFLDESGLGADYDALLAGAAGSTLFDLAEVIRSGRRRSIRALEAGCRALLLLARDLGVPVALAETTAGAVTLHLSGAGPFDRRAVVKGHTVRATDAEWAFGHGPVLEGTSTAIAAFLLGASDDPPRPPVTDAR